MGVWPVVRERPTWCPPGVGVSQTVDTCQGDAPGAAIHGLDLTTHLGTDPLEQQGSSTRAAPHLERQSTTSACLLSSSSGGNSTRQGHSAEGPDACQSVCRNVQGAASSEPRLWPAINDAGIVVNLLF
ncbi:MAG: hypothetical protein OXI08_03855 [Cyanobacteria bacterium MAG IRC4_bin_6]|nr:hypothetical protein [Cyanobacteria bacterium MAG IRC4_bin_6]MYG64505.1 hypothetical protein [Synechococcus sp. SB0675_bin_7]